MGAKSKDMDTFLEKNEDMEMKDRVKHEEKKDSLPNNDRNVKRGPMSCINACLNSIENGTIEFVKQNMTMMKVILALILFGLFLWYYIKALTLDFDRALNFFYITKFAICCFLYWLIKKYYGRAIWKSVLKPTQQAILSVWIYVKWFSILTFTIFFIVWVAVDTAKKPGRLISLAGLFVYVLIGFLFSKKRDQVKWRPVLWGFALQFVFGLLILRTSVGYQFFAWLGDRVTIFLDFSTAGSEFVFGKTGMYKHHIAFVVLPVIVYFSAFTYLVYYLGLIQIVIKKLAWLLQISLGTSPAESINAAGNIFIGQTEAPLLIRPFLEGMTESELHAVMTGGFATIAGSVLGAYVAMGVSPSHLLSASVMSAPAALAMAKLMYPEIEEPEVKSVDDIKIEQSDEKNMFEALSVGASMSIGLVANIAVMLIAFLSILSFVNGILGWLGRNVGVYGLSFEYICSYVFMPFAYMMGVDWNDCSKVAELLGVKTFLNEFIAYQKLSAIILNRINNTGGGIISIRSEIIATYALCGFANFGSMGVQLGGIASLAPSRRPALARVVFRALCAGTMACFMTACIAGMLAEDDKYDTIFKAERPVYTTILSLINATTPISFVNTTTPVTLLNKTISTTVNGTV